MSAIMFIAMPTDVARAYQAGTPDANGQKPERHISDGTGVLRRVFGHAPQ
jgi:hypothetical protein